MKSRTDTHTASLSHTHMHRWNGKAVLCKGFLSISKFSKKCVWVCVCEGPLCRHLGDMKSGSMACIPKYYKTHTQTELWREDGGTEGRKGKNETQTAKERMTPWFTSLFIPLQCAAKSHQFAFHDGFTLTHKHTQLPPVPMVTWRRGGRDLTIELFTQQQHTHTHTTTYLTYGSHTCIYSRAFTHWKHDIIYLWEADFWISASPAHEHHS